MTANSRPALNKSAEPKKSSGFLYAWLIVSLIFEYARPAAFVPALDAIPLNSLLPLSLLVVSSFATGLRPVKVIAANRLAWWLLLFLALVTLGVVHADVTFRAFTTFKSCLGYVFLAFLIARIATTRGRIFGIIATLIVAHLFLLAMNPLVILDPANRNYVRGATFLGDGNDFALSLCMLVPMALALALTRSSAIARIAAFGVTLVLALAIVGTSSRGATLGLAGVVLFLVSISNRKWPALVAAGLLVVAVIVYAPATYFERVRTVTTYEEDTSATARIEAWKAGARMALSNPVLGVGAGNFPNSLPRYRGPNAPVRWMTAHSMYFLVLGELGIPGIVTLLVLVFGNIRSNLRAMKDMRTAIREQRGGDPRDAIVLQNLAAAGIGLAIAGAFLSVAYYPHVFVMTALAIAAQHVAFQGVGRTSPTTQRDGANDIHGRRRKPTDLTPSPNTAYRDKWR